MGHKLTDKQEEEWTSCYRTYGTITISSPKISPDDITKKLEIEPSTVRKIGDKIVGSRRYKANMWKYSSQYEVASKDVREHLNYLFDLLDVKYSDVLELISNGCEISFAVFWESCAYAGFGGGPLLDCRTMERALKFHGDIWFDVYFNFDQSDDKH